MANKYQKYYDDFVQPDKVKHIKIKNLQEALDIIYNIEYKSDPVGCDEPQNVTTTLKKKTGDCEDTAFLMVSILIANGYEARLAQYKGHLSAVVNSRGKWILMDRGSNKPGNIPKELKNRTYNTIPTIFEINKKD